MLEYGMPPLAAALLAAVAGMHPVVAHEPGGWRRCDVEDFGAVAGDGLSDSAAIRAALVVCGGPRGGEIVLRGPGAYDSAPMNLTSNQALRVASGAVLRAPLVNTTGHCQNEKTPCPYAVMDRFPSYQSSRSGFGCRLGPFIGELSRTRSRCPMLLVMRFGSLAAAVLLPRCCSRSACQSEYTGH